MNIKNLQNFKYITTIENEMKHHYLLIVPYDLSNGYPINEGHIEEP